jgi:hypothetical protein
MDTRQSTSPILKWTDRAYTWQAGEALRLAHENKLAPIDRKEVIRAAEAEITETHVKAACEVARAWDHLAKQLERLRSEDGPGHQPILSRIGCPWQSV